MCACSRGSLGLNEQRPVTPLPACSLQEEVTSLREQLTEEREQVRQLQVTSDSLFQGAERIKEVHMHTSRDLRAALDEVRAEHAYVEVHSDIAGACTLLPFSTV